MLMLLITLLIMQRGKYDTVTDQFRLPVLIRATAETSEGFATFEIELGQPHVRMFKDSDLKNAKRHLTETEAKHFHAVMALVQALRDPKDSIALKKARAAIESSYELRRTEPRFGGPPLPGLAEGLAKYVGMSPQHSLEVWEGKRAGPRAAANPAWQLSFELSNELSLGARLVLWWTPDRRFCPAIWCQDMKTAFYVRALLTAFGGKGLRICPHCSEPFFQERRDQDYCSVQHREAHRVARWRAAKASKSKMKGRKNGTKKTR